MLLGNMEVNTKIWYLLLRKQKWSLLLRKQKWEREARKLCGAGWFLDHIHG